MSRPYCRIVCNEIVFEVTDEHVLSDLWDFPEPVPLREIASLRTRAHRQGPGHLVIASLGLAIGVLAMYLLLRDHDLGLATRVLFWILSAVFIIHFGVVLRNYLTKPLREIFITTVGGREGLLLKSSDPKTFDPFYAALQAALADREAANGAARATTDGEATL
jgi:hypothetical protein